MTDARIRPVVFVHGFGGGSHEYAPIIRFLKQQGSYPCYEFSYAQKYGEVSLAVIASHLHTFIETHIFEKEIDIVAISQGGVIARSYIGTYTDRKVRRCITLCTPHHGSLTAFLSSRPGILELRPKSSFMRVLNVSGAEYYSVYNPLDLMVFPGWSAQWEYAKENKCVIALVHPLTFSDRSTLAFIHDVLSRA